MAFPHIPSNQYTDDGEAIHGASVASNRLLSNLTEWARQDTVPRFTMVVINYLTLVRNCYDANPATLMGNITKELDFLSTYVDAYMRHTRLPATRKVPILIYVPTYKKLPASIRREPTAEMKRVFTVAPKAEEVLNTISSVIKPGERCQIQCVTTGSSKLYPHEELRSELSRLSREFGFGYNYGEPYLCISHIQLDWHLASNLPNMKLCESYTGRVLTLDQFGDKLTGLKNAHVPFTSELHRVFGDNTFVGGLVARRKKKEMLEAAKQWAVTPTTKILQQMSTISEVPASEIKTPSF